MGFSLIKFRDSLGPCMLISRFRSPTLVQKGGGGSYVFAVFLFTTHISGVKPFGTSIPYVSSYSAARWGSPVRYRYCRAWPASAIQAVKSGRQEGSGAVRTIKVRSGVVPEGDSLSVLLRARCCARTLCCKSLRVLYALRPAPPAPLYLGQEYNSLPSKHPEQRR